MGPDMVVLVPPGVEGCLLDPKFGARRLPPQVVLQGAVEALVLAWGFRVVGPAVANGDAQPARPIRLIALNVGRGLSPSDTRGGATLASQFAHRLGDEFRATYLV